MYKRRVRSVVESDIRSVLSALEVAIEEAETVEDVRWVADEVEFYRIRIGVLALIFPSLEGILQVLRRVEPLLRHYPEDVLDRESYIFAEVRYAHEDLSAYLRLISRKDRENATPPA